MYGVPITPLEVEAAYNTVLPNRVIDIWNGLIVDKWDGFSAVVKQDVLMEALLPARLGLRQDIYANGWLNVERLYRRYGWEVEYEPYTATYTFRKGKDK